MLVFSDSHMSGRMSMRKAIMAQPQAEVVIFLGDGISDFNSCADLLGDKRVYSVRGNNDFGCKEPLSQVISEGGINIYITHGHYDYVKSSLGTLLSNARSNSCTLALYGHTHVQQQDYCDGTYLFNPGALLDFKYGVVDITDKGLICIGMEVKL